MTTWYTQATGNLSAIALNTAADGSGTAGTYQDVAVTDSVILYGHTVTQDVSPFTCASIANDVTLGGQWLIASGTRVLNVASVDGLTNNKADVYVLYISSGTACTLNGEFVAVGQGVYNLGTLILNNPDGYAVRSTASSQKYVVFNNGTSATANGNLLLKPGNNTTSWYNRATATFNGNIICDSSSSNCSAVGDVFNGGTITLNGLPITLGSAPALLLAGIYTCFWNGTRTNAAGQRLYIRQDSSTLDLSDQGNGALNLANSGSLFLLKSSGTLTTTGARIRNVSPSGQVMTWLDSGSLSVVQPGWNPRPLMIGV